MWLGCILTSANNYSILHVYLGWVPINQFFRAARHCRLTEHGAAFGSAGGDLAYLKLKPARLFP